MLLDLFHAFGSNWGLIALVVIIVVLGAWRIAQKGVK